MGGDSTLRCGARAPTNARRKTKNERGDVWARAPTIYIRAGRELWFSGQDYYWFVGAGDDGFGDGDQAILRAENAEAKRLPFAAIEFGGGALSGVCAARLDVGDLNIKFCAVAHGALDGGENGDARKFGEHALERDHPLGDAAFACGGGEVFDFHCLIESEFADGGANDFREMRSAAEALAHIECEGT